MLGKIGTLARQLRYQWRSRHALPQKPRKRKAKTQKPGWGESYYGYSHAADAPPRGASAGPYDNNRPRGLAGLLVEAVLRRLARRRG